MSLELQVDLAQKIENPCWEYVRQVPTSPYSLASMYGSKVFTPTHSEIQGNKYIGHRSRVIGTWAWAIPSPESLGFIVHVLDGRPIVEIGAGSGYWAWMLSQMLVDVNAYDAAPIGHIESWYGDTGENARLMMAEFRDAGWTHEPREFYPVAPGSIEVLAQQDPNRVLFLCWPSYDTPFGHDTVKAFRGDTIIYIGEGPGGCCGDDDMFDLLWHEWEEVEYGPMIQWDGLHDTLTIYQRLHTPRTKEEA